MNKLTAFKIIYVLVILASFFVYLDTQDTTTFLSVIVMATLALSVALQYSIIKKLDDLQKQMSEN